MFNLRNDLEDILDDLTAPRALRREIDRLFSEDLSPRSMWQQMERLFDDFVSPSSLRRRAAALFEPFGTTFAAAAPSAWSSARGRDVFTPDLELIEQDKEYVLDIDLPGVRQEDVHVSVNDDNVLTVEGQRRAEETKRARGYEYTERSYGSFSRSVELPRGVEASKIEADYRDGVLRLHIPKGTRIMGRQIPVKAREITHARAETEREQPRVVAAGAAATSGDGGVEKREVRTTANSR